MMDLTTGDAGALFSTLQKKTRRDIRLPARRGLEFRIIDDPNFVPRLEVISRATTMRTGGIYNPINWRRVIRFISALSRSIAASRHVFVNSDKLGHLTRLPWAAIMASTLTMRLADRFVRLASTHRYRTHCCLGPHILGAGKQGELVRPWNQQMGITPPTALRVYPK